ncbi:hypothetical protein BDB00DRAFT_859960 [Zychaea mexicana]|uniref:uncharacterized protein n=1 Tax=Zychaea mexicana TaxID=64656 RepID=UPI0022FF456C|nr:uncharacterized protein BDB00DRAFT_859960 [Zychaea mexicana]KAI9475350.1 hypothetical protein BDB00DRAFT_859960 [Zychaea mexicana]
MKASYILALFAVLAVSASANQAKDNQYQSADNTAAQLTNNGQNTVGVNGALGEGVGVLASKEQTGTVVQTQNKD